MRASLRFLATLSGCAALGGAAALAVIGLQEHRLTRATAVQLAGGSVDAGRHAIRRYGCGACHEVPGVDGADGKVGPSLKGMAGRAQIAGRLVNRPDDLVRWIRHPKQVDPGNGMPDLSVTEADARDIATYLYTLR